MSRFRYLYFVIFATTPLILITNGQTTKSIPKLLRGCYKDNYINTMPQPPLTVQLLVELIRKLEFDKGNALNMRILTSSMQHAVQLDGIVQTATANPDLDLPFKALGSHFYKYQLLVDYFTTGETSLFPQDSVTTYEFCLLHKIISNSLESQTRGDEKDTCPQGRSIPSSEITRGNPHSSEGKSWTRIYQTEEDRMREMESVSQPQISNCPIEKGVVRTKWGPISPSHIISGIASTLEETRETYNTIARNTPHKNFTNIVNATLPKEARTFAANRTRSSKAVEISSIWLSTIVGDLGEVVVNQAFRKPMVGIEATWNDTLYPRRHYLNEKQWDMSRAELLGGLDGAIISSKIKEWLNVLDGTRLSQIIDMYYSGRGVGYDLNYKACDRNSKLRDLFQYVNLHEQTFLVAVLIQNIGDFKRYISDEGLEFYTSQVIPEYHQVSEKLTKLYDVCDLEKPMTSRLEILVIVDGSWKRYEAERMIAYLTEEAGVSFYGSSMGIINGQTGRWMTNVTNDLVQLFSELQSESLQTNWPTSLTLSRSLNTVVFYYENKTTTDCRVSGQKSKPEGKVILVLANSARIDDIDSQNTHLSLQSIKKSHPEVKIVYATKADSAANFQQFLRDARGDVVVKGNDEENLVHKVIEELRGIPAHVLNIFCDQATGHFEDYLTPEIPSVYQVHHEYVIRGNIHIRFKGNHYSKVISVCAYSLEAVENKVCKAITVNNDEVTFNVRDHCSAEHACSVHFSVLAKNTAFRCTELDCRYPDQVRIDVTSQFTAGAAALWVNFLLMHALIMTLWIVGKE